MDRASGSGPEGRGFKSLRAHFVWLLWCQDIPESLEDIKFFIKKESPHLWGGECQPEPDIAMSAGHRTKF